MRWFIQIVVMLSDIFLLLACVFVVCNVSFFLSYPLVYIAYSTWKKQGGLIAWTHPRLFLTNYKGIFNEN